MKKELFAITAFFALLLASVANLVHLRTLVTDIATHLDYTNMYCHQEDYTAAKAELSKAMSIWQNSEDYSHIFIRQTEVDDLTDLFYDLRISLAKSEKDEAMGLIEKLNHKCRMMIDMEQISLESIF